MLGLMFSFLLSSPHAQAFFLCHSLKNDFELNEARWERRHFEASKFAHELRSGMGVDLWQFSLGERNFLFKAFQLTSPQPGNKILPRSEVATHFAKNVLGLQADEWRPFDSIDQTDLDHVIAEFLKGALANYPARLSADVQNIGNGFKEYLNFLTKWKKDRSVFVTKTTTSHSAAVFIVVQHVENSVAVTNVFALSLDPRIPVRPKRKSP